MFGKIAAQHLSSMGKDYSVGYHQCGQIGQFLKVLKKWANPGLFLFIFVLFKHKLYKKTVGFSSGIRTRIIREGEHANHLIATTALEIGCFFWFKRIANLSKKLSS